MERDGPGCEDHLEQPRGALENTDFVSSAGNFFANLFTSHQSYHSIFSRLVFLPKLSRQCQGGSEGDGPRHEDSVEQPQGRA